MTVGAGNAVPGVSQFKKARLFVSQHTPNAPKAVKQVLRCLKNKGKDLS